MILRENWKENQIDNIPVGAKPHPAVSIIIWLCLSVAAYSLKGHALYILAGVSIALASGLCASPFVRLLLRMRWILISMLIIYAYGTQGSLMSPALGTFSPVAEGVSGGLLQMLRVATVLAGLSVMLARLNPAQLIAGLYTLAWPMQYFGLSRERFALRLSLTLNYAETNVPDAGRGWRAWLDSLLASRPEQSDFFVELHIVSLSRRDWLFIALVSAALAGVLL